MSFTTQMLAELKAHGATKVVIDYSGSGDEGQANRATVVEPDVGLELPDALERALLEAAESELGERYSGWGDNFGSHGEVIIDVEHEKVTIKHGWYVRSTDWEAPEEIEIEHDDR